MKRSSSFASFVTEPDRIRPKKWSISLFFVYLMFVVCTWSYKCRLSHQFRHDRPRRSLKRGVCVCKVLKYIVITNVISHMDQHNLSYDLQHGFVCSLWLWYFLIILTILIQPLMWDPACDSHRRPHEEFFSRQPNRHCPAGISILNLSLA